MGETELKVRGAGAVVTCELWLGSVRSDPLRSLRFPKVPTGQGREDPFLYAHPCDPNKCPKDEFLH